VVFGVEEFGFGGVFGRCFGVLECGLMMRFGSLEVDFGKRNDVGKRGWGIYN
jgi:hypothetical protein